MQPMLDALTSAVLAFTAPPVWAEYRAANAHGVPAGMPSFALGVAHANTGGQDSSGSDSQPIPPSNAGTTALDTAGVAYDGSPSTAFNQIVTSLVLRNVVERLRDDLVVLQAGTFVRARNVPGTKDFVYTMFADLGTADNLLEGVPPVTVPLAWDTFSFTGTQKGKVVAITDLADLISPFDLYAQAAEKVAWNALETAENDAVTLFMGSTGVSVTVGLPTIAENILAAVIALKKGDVPMFPDGSYHALISPTDAGLVMVETGPLGWTEASKYGTPENLLNGELGKFRGVRFIESNRITDGKVSVFGPSAVAWGDYQTIQAYRVAPGGNHADPLAQRGLVGWKGMWGTSIVGFDGSPAAGPTANAEGYRFTTRDLTTTV